MRRLYISVLLAIPAQFVLACWSLWQGVLTLAVMLLATMIVSVAALIHLSRRPFYQLGLALSDKLDGEKQDRISTGLEVMRILEGLASSITLSEERRYSFQAQLRVLEESLGVRLDSLSERIAEFEGRVRDVSAGMHNLSSSIHSNAEAHNAQVVALANSVKLTRSHFERALIEMKILMEELGGRQGEAFRNAEGNAARREAELANLLNARVEALTTSVDKVVEAARSEVELLASNYSSQQLKVLESMMESRGLLEVGDTAKGAPGEEVYTSKLLKELARLDSRYKEDSARHVTEATRAIERRLEYIRIELERLPSYVLGATRAASLVMPPGSIVPLLGGWALTAPCIDVLTTQIVSRGDVEILLECGSGASTVWLAAAMRRKGRGHVYALEHLHEYAATTRRYLEVNGLSSYATVVVAPLRDTSVEEENYSWYQIDQASLPERIDILLVDGPPGGTGPLARYPAVPLLGSRLADRCLVVLDDMVRNEEKEIAERWLSKSHGGARLSEVMSLPKTSIFEVARTDDPKRPG